MTTTPTAWSDSVVFEDDPFAFNPRVTALKDGTFVITWGSDNDIAGKHLDEMGSFTAGDFLRNISAGTTLALVDAIVTQQSDDSIVVNYDFNSGDVTTDRDVYWAGINSDFDSTTTPFGTEKSGFDEILLDSVAHGATGAGDPAGGAIVYQYTGPGDVTNLVMRFTTNIGDQASNQIFIDSSATRIEQNAALASLHTGFVAVAYESFNPTDSSRDVRMEVYSPDGSLVTGDIIVSAADANSAFPDVTELHGGSFVVTWQQAGGIAFRRYFANGTPLDAAPVLIPATTSGLLPKITPLNDGGFIVAWSAPDSLEGDGGFEYDIFLQRYDAAGTAIGDTVHIDEAGDQVFGMNITTLSDGRVVMAYSSETGNGTNVTTLNYRIFDPRESTIDGTNGNDNIVGRLDASTINGLDGNDRLTGMDQDDKIAGGLGDDTLMARGGKDLMSGGLGNDTLFGGAGNDSLRGNGGADIMTGGAGADTFVFKLLQDSTTDASGRDTIMDFRRGQGDEIDLHTIDANTKKGGNQAFDFIGTNGFHHDAGELRVVHQNGDTFLKGDVDGDGKADFSIELQGDVKVKEADLVL